MQLNDGEDLWKKCTQSATISVQSLWKKRQHGTYKEPHRIKSFGRFFHPVQALWEDLQVKKFACKAQLCQPQGMERYVIYHPYFRSRRALKYHGAKDHPGKINEYNQHWPNIFMLFVCKLLFWIYFYFCGWIGYQITFWDMIDGHQSGKIRENYCAIFAKLFWPSEVQPNWHVRVIWQCNRGPLECCQII